MDEGCDVHPRRQGTREEGLPGESLEGRFGEEERDGRERQSTRDRLGRIRDADRGQDEERGCDSGAAPIKQEIGRKCVDGEGGEPGAQGQARGQEPPVPPELQPDPEPQHHANIDRCHPRRPVNELPGQQAPDLAGRHAGAVIRQGVRR